MTRYHLVIGANRLTRLGQLCLNLSRVLCGASIVIQHL